MVCSQLHIVAVIGFLGIIGVFVFFRIILIIGIRIDIIPVIIKPGAFIVE